MKTKIIILFVSITIYSIFCLSAVQAKTRVLRVGTSADYPPFSFQDKGKLKGFEIDLAQAIGKRLSRQVEIHNIPFASLIPALKTNRIDIIISALSSTEERKKSIDFSDTYHTPTLSFLYLKKKPINKVSQLKNLRVGAETGSVMFNVGKYFQKANKFELVAIDSVPELFKELETNHFQVVIIETVQGKSFLERNKTVEYTPIPLKAYPSNMQAGYAIGLRKKSPLLTSINNTIRYLKNKGVIAKLRTKWIGK